MVDYEINGKFSILWVNNPPVNAISYLVRQGLYDSIHKANADKNVQAIIIIGRNSTFLSGADINEFKQFKGIERLPRGTNLGLIEVTDAIEDSNKPVIAAIQKFCMGGGLEIATSAHYRLADENCRFSFPEVNLGILPAATGTQRFPRLTSLQFSLDVIATGRVFSSREALQNGAIDKIFSKNENILETAKAFAKTIIGSNLDVRRTSKRNVKDADKKEELISKTQSFIARRYKESAPKYCIQAVAASVRPYREGLMTERMLSYYLFTSVQSRSMQYSFFIERSCQKWQLPNGSNWKNTKGEDIKTAGVIGAGTMGGGITISLLRVNIPVILVEQNEEALTRGVTFIKNIFERDVKLKRIDGLRLEKLMDLLKPTTCLDDVSTCDVIIEAVYENLKLKQDIFTKLDKLCKSNAILCTNTSTLSIDSIASATKRPSSVIGAHFFSPAHIMRLIEIIKGSEYCPNKIASVMKLAKRINKIGVLVGNCDGFVSNRINNFGSMQMSFLLEDGVDDPRIIDNALEDFGMAMGKFRVSDVAGIDIGLLIIKEGLKQKGLTFDKNKNIYNGARISLLSNDLVELGRKGQKSSIGFYRYIKGSSQAIFDPDILNIVQKYRQRMGISKRQITYQEIIERNLYSMINESFYVLQEGIASKPEDIDAIMLFGFGFPKHVGGIMNYANEFGLKKIYEKILFYQSTYPDQPYWQPSKLLQKIVKDEIPMKLWATAAKTINKL